MSEESPLQKVSQLSKYEAKLLFLRCQEKGYVEISQLLHASQSKIQSDIGDVYEKLGLPRDLRKKEDREKLDVYCKAINGFVSSIKEIEDGWPPEEYKPEEPVIIPPPPPTTRNRNIGIIIGGGIIIMCLCCLIGYRITRVIPLNFFDRTPEPTEVPIIPTNTPLPPTATPTITQTPTVTPSPTITNTSPPTDTLVPTDTPTITYTPLPSATPVPVLFEDDFEDGLDPAWVILDGDPIVSNGRLNANEHTWLSIGIPTWTNYSVEFLGRCETYEFVQGSPCITGIRAQDKDNMVAVKWTYYDLMWSLIENGNRDDVPGTRYRRVNNTPYDLKITADQNNYVYYVRGENVSFSKEIYPQGYVVFWLRAGSWIDDFRVIALP